MSEGTLQALRDRINARLQASAISRDRASAAGREVVAQCRQSDVETLEWVLSEIDAALRARQVEAVTRAAYRGERERGLIMLAMAETFPWSPDIRQEHFERAADAVIAALRSEAQGEDRWEDVVFGPITEAYNEAHAARRGEGGGG